MAALRCSRRKLYNLYIYASAGDFSDSGTQLDDGFVRTARKLGYAAGAKVKDVTGKWIHLLDKMSGGRPHNGLVLEASPLPKLPVDYYEPVPSPSVTHFEVKVAAQSEEEEAVNGTDNLIPRLNQNHTTSDTVLDTRHRYPFTLFLDGILDPGNLGAIIRSAYYLGVDAIAFSARNSAPFSPVTLKASAGAAENMPLLSVANPASFIDTSRNNGWQFFAAEAPASAVASLNALDQNNLPQRVPTVLSLSGLSSKLTESPCVLMLGGEGFGLSKKLRKRVSAFVAIPGTFTNSSADDLAGVDSLNVSVASALLCEAFLRQSPPADGREATASQLTTRASENTGAEDTINAEKRCRADANKVF
jgi:21S rRNA (GM2251-2'-O)-methyltransferase